MLLPLDIIWGRYETLIVTFCLLGKNSADGILTDYIAINIKLLKCAIKAEELACRYHKISAHLLDIAHLLWCLLILPLHGVAFDDVVMQWRRAKPCKAHW